MWLWIVVTVAGFLLLWLAWFIVMESVRKAYQKGRLEGFEIGRASVLEQWKNGEEQSGGSSVN